MTGMHVDTWYCARCPQTQFEMTTDYDYDVSCFRCGKTMTLLVRSQEEPDPLPDVVSEIMATMPHELRSGI
jgi:PHP family Zn ribbon phosphoesterase